MIKSTISLIFTIAVFYSVNAQSNKLTSFFNHDPVIENKVNEIFNSLNESSRVAQMIITSAGELGKPESVVSKLALQNKIGGVIFLKGTKDAHKKMIAKLNSTSQSQKQLPLLYSIDAEPILFNSRLIGSTPVMNTIDIKTCINKAKKKAM